jgi:hypothetical protein
LTLALSLSKGRLLRVELEESFLTVYAELRALGLLQNPLDRAKETAALSRVRYWDGARFVAHAIRD